MRDHVRLRKHPKEGENILFANTDVPHIPGDFSRSFDFLADLHYVQNQSCVLSESKINVQVPIRILSRKDIDLIFTNLYRERVLQNLDFL